MFSTTVVKNDVKNEKTKIKKNPCIAAILNFFFWGRYYIYNVKHIKYAKGGL